MEPKPKHQLTQTEMAVAFFYVVLVMPFMFVTQFTHPAMAWFIAPAAVVIPFSLYFLRARARRWPVSKLDVVVATLFILQALCVGYMIGHPSSTVWPGVIVLLSLIAMRLIRRLYR